ncbi:MAG: hypothetical protein R3D33_14010 [Hyphomicrobiaceae bacterium]
MRISRLVLCLAALVAALMVGGPGFEARAGSSGLQPEDAFDRGLKAYRQGNLEDALPLIDFAATNGYVRAQFVLARIYGERDTRLYDPAAAFHIYESIVENNKDIDPYLDENAPYVAAANVAAADYLMKGIPGIGLAPDRAKARELLEFAASYFDDTDAQFELAKLILTDARPDVQDESATLALHYLSTLAEEKQHAGAQAFLGDLFWEGEHVGRRPDMGLALVSIALGNATAGDRLWIEEIYHDIYCRTAREQRAEAARIVARWDERHGAARSAGASEGGSAFTFGEVGGVKRTCANGEPIASRLTPEALAVAEQGGDPEASGGAVASAQGAASSEDAGARPTFGNMMGLGLGISAEDAGGESALKSSASASRARLAVAGYLSLMRASQPRCRRCSEPRPRR